MQHSECTQMNALKWYYVSKWMQGHADKWMWVSECSECNQVTITQWMQSSECNNENAAIWNWMFAIGWKSIYESECIQMHANVRECNWQQIKMTWY